MAQATEEKAERLQRFLEGEDAPCPICGYNLRHLKGTTCPECGAALELRVGSMDLKLGRWIALLISLVIPVGYGVVELFFAVLWIARDIISNGYTGQLGLSFSWYWPLMVLAGLTGALLAAAIFLRRRFWLLTDQLQRLWLCSTFVIVGAAIGVYFYSVYT